MYGPIHESGLVDSKEHFGAFQVSLWTSHFLVFLFVCLFVLFFLFLLDLAPVGIAAFGSCDIK